MNFIDAARLGRDDAATIGIRPEHIRIDPADGEWKGKVLHAEHLGADTILYFDVEKAGLISVRLFGEHRYHADDVLHLTPDPVRIYRFDAGGRIIR
jgi:multiple sugar transport system ATP-binding protein